MIHSDGMHVGDTLPIVQGRNHGRSNRTGWPAGRSRLGRWLAVSVLVALAAALAGLERVVVEGTSMVPTLEPGDRLVVMRLPRRCRLRKGRVVAVRDPRRPDRVLAKRVASVDGQRESHVVVAGDNPGASTDSRMFGPVPRRSVVGICVYRYAPADRAGRVV